jgi:hypothetical protein
MSSTELVVKYLAERSRPLILGLLSLLLAAAGLLLAPSSGVNFVRYLESAAQAFLLILAFRVWDDLADRERDAVEHPGRVVVVSGRVGPFALLGVVLGVGALVPIALAADAVARLAALGIAAGSLAIWYRVRPTPLSSSASPPLRIRTSSASGGSAASLGGHVVLIKYPAIAFAVAPSVPRLDLRAAATLASLYLVLCIYESFDDPALRASARARRIAITELVLLIPLIIATASFSGVGLP